MNKRTKMLVFGAMCVTINIVFSMVVTMLNIPLIFMDTMGTILCAALFGPLAGAVVGLVTNVLTAVVNNPIEIPFALVNMTIGIVVGFISKKKGFSLPVAIITGLILAVVAPLIGTPIVVWLFGGVTGKSTDFLVGWLLASGHKIFTAAFIPRITGNLVDKVASCLMAYAVIKAIPMSLKKGTLLDETK